MRAGGPLFLATTQGLAVNGDGFVVILTPRVGASILAMSETAMLEAETARANARAISDIAQTSATTRDRMEQMRDAMDGLVGRASTLLRKLRFFRLGSTGALRGSIVTTGGPHVTPQVPTGGPALFSGWRTGGAAPTGAPTVAPLESASPPPWTMPSEPKSDEASSVSDTASPDAPMPSDAELVRDAEVVSGAGPEPRGRETVPIPIVEGTLADAVDASYTPDVTDQPDAGQTMPIRQEDVQKQTAPPGQPGDAVQR